ncbi:MAG: hypothetical protein IK128_03485 [Clostridiales bacterium]|nr:hypothetical protein [Clostridiales bacterium]
MERRKGYIVVIAAAAAFLLLITGLMLNAASRKKQTISLANQASYAAEKLSTRDDLMIYWIGTFPPELAGISDVVTVINPGEITEENMPIKYSSFKSTEYDEFGNVVNEIVPRDYKDNMIIIISNVGMITDAEKDVLLNCIAQNNVPVLAIGRSSITLIRRTLMYTDGVFEQDDSFYYKLGEGYKDHVLDNAAITAGGDEYALELCEYLYSLFYDDAEEIETTAAETTLTETTQNPFFFDETEAVEVTPEVTPEMESGSAM